MKYARPLPADPRREPAPAALSRQAQQAFRAGLLGWRFARAVEVGAGQTGYAFGANERRALATQRFPGLGPPASAFAGGRALRGIAKLLDKAGAPAAMGEQFIDNLVAAAVAEAARGRPQPWGAADTVGMFMELYGRIMQPAPAEAAQIEAALLRYALDEDAALPGARGADRPPQ